MTERWDNVQALRRGPLVQLADLTPPADITPDTFAARLYVALAPLAQQDASYGWSLLVLCNAIGEMFQLAEDLVRDTPDGPGWSLLLDLDRCPPEALPWLAQFVGVRLLPGSTVQAQRDRIASTDGFKRGTRDALIGAAQATLTGTQKVVFRERDGASMGYPNDPERAYCLTVTTYADQTPNPTATLNALLAQKPGGILMRYRSATGQDWELVKEGYATWADVKAHYPTWTDVMTDEP